MTSALSQFDDDRYTVTSVAPGGPEASRFVHLRFEQTQQVPPATHHTHLGGLADRRAGLARVRGPASLINARSCR